jgi:hypothetical protein
MQLAYLIQRVSIFPKAHAKEQAINGRHALAGSCRVRSLRAYRVHANRLKTWRPNIQQSATTPTFMPTISPGRVGASMRDSIRCLYKHHRVKRARLIIIDQSNGETAALAPNTAAQITTSLATSQAKTLPKISRPSSSCCRYTRTYVLPADRRRRCRTDTLALLHLHAKVIKRRFILSCSHGASMVIVAPYNTYIF